MQMSGIEEMQKCGKAEKQKWRNVDLQKIRNVEKQKCCNVKMQESRQLEKQTYINVNMEKVEKVVLTVLNVVHLTPYKTS